MVECKRLKSARSVLAERSAGSNPVPSAIYIPRPSSRGFSLVVDFRENASWYVKGPRRESGAFITFRVTGV